MNSLRVSRWKSASDSARRPRSSCSATRRASASTFATSAAAADISSRIASACITTLHCGHPSRLNEICFPGTSESFALSICRSRHGWWYTCPQPSCTHGNSVSSSKQIAHSSWLSSPQQSLCWHFCGCTCSPRVPMQGWPHPSRAGQCTLSFRQHSSLRHEAAATPTECVGCAHVFSQNRHVARTHPSSSCSLAAIASSCARSISSASNAAWSDCAHSASRSCRTCSRRALSASSARAVASSAATRLASSACSAASSARAAAASSRSCSARDSAAACVTNACGGVDAAAPAATAGEPAANPRGSSQVPHTCTSAVLTTVQCAHVHSAGGTPAAAAAAATAAAGGGGGGATWAGLVSPQAAHSASLATFSSVHVPHTQAAAAAGLAGLPAAKPAAGTAAAAGVPIGAVQASHAGDPLSLSIVHSPHSQLAVEAAAEAERGSTWVRGTTAAAPEEGGATEEEGSGCCSGVSGSACTAAAPGPTGSGGADGAATLVPCSRPLSASQTLHTSPPWFSTVHCPHVHVWLLLGRTRGAGTGGAARSGTESPLVTGARERDTSHTWHCVSLHRFSAEHCRHVHPSTLMVLLLSLSSIGRLECSMKYRYCSFY
eukprot:Rhum_TRINITY_DN15045_c5_g1::Rhum_TRINITY_DN15045_c5_g1_i3::g.135082::m.135082